MRLGAWWLRGGGLNNVGVGGGGGGGVLIMWVCGVWEVLVPVIIKPGLPKINQNKPRLNYVSHSGCVRKAILVKMETSMIRK